MKVLILGCGYTGLRFAQRLIKAHIPVSVTNRSGSIPGLSCFPFAHVLEEPPALPPPSAYNGVTHVLSTIPPDPQGQDPVVIHLLSTLEKLPLQWFGYLSTTGVYGDSQGAWVDEESPVKPQSVRSQNRVTAETQWLQSSLPTHIFRLPGIYGPGRSIFDRLKAGTARHILKPGHVFSRIHVDDIVQTLHQSMQHPQPGSIYNVADDLPSEPRTLIEAGSQLLGIQPPPALAYADAQLSPMAQSFWQECRRVSNLKIKTDLGIQLLHPSYREGLKSIWMLENA
ncbi:SDR family oxidoreductase [Acaryochloris sp. IP29b_bin.137]|uniref:SDR family oxidoreductase n=1 Tax=Acaryochloris sp. IP29b_bin.137 TaxID=2969217 RepID=UPI002616C5AA|nr:SDR family oxidoreductase [Acaryochloris sp. IP29b_bin.137]